jgi:hypothetical protein
MARISKAPTELYEWANVSDVYVDGIGRIDSNGAISHLMFYMRRHGDTGTQREVVLRLIVPTAELTTMARQLANAELTDTTATEATSDEDSMTILLH